MPAVSLPMLPGEPSICASAEGLDAFLVPVNDPFMQARIGTEVVLLREGPLVITQGDKFRNKEGWAQGRRYLHTDATGTPVAVLNVSIRKLGKTKQAVASNVYTHPGHRRQGLAAGLLRRAQVDLPGLQADNALSQAGAALVGHGAQPRKTPRP